MDNKGILDLNFSCTSGILEFSTQQEYIFAVYCIIAHILSLPLELFIILDTEVAFVRARPKSYSFSEIMNVHTVDARNFP